MVRIPSSTYQIYNIKLPDKLKFEEKVILSDGCFGGIFSFFLLSRIFSLLSILPPFFLYFSPLSRKKNTSAS